MLTHKKIPEWQPALNPDETVMVQEDCF